MMNAYLDKGLKGVYAVVIGVVVVAALRTPLTGQQQPQPQQPVAAQPQASPVQPAPSPSVQQAQPQQPQQQQAGQYYDPALQAKVSEVRGWTPQAIQDWIQFCHQTAGGTGFTVEDQRICLAISILQRESQL